MPHANAKPAVEPGHEWYQSAVLYEVDVKNFYDANGDGIGDFAGLIDRLDHLVDLGVDCVWLQPFYPSPDRDNGYDISDYYDVDPRLGTLADFDRFIAAATARGLRVIADLPLNHVSDQHAWFQAARRDRASEFYDYFIWRDDLPADNAPYPIFGPEQGGNWERDEVAGRYYFHTFYRFMPDLNMSHPSLRERLLDVARFWMNRGLCGFRLDAVPYLVQFISDAEKMQHPHDFLRDLHHVVDEVRPDAVLIAEANLKPAEMKPYFGDGDQMHLLLNFYLCNHLFLAAATQAAEPIVRAWGELPDIPVPCNWANFCRNHDELSLDQLTKAERQTCFDAFAPEDRMQLYGRGIRRRLAPMVDGDQRRLELIYSLHLSLPGTPVVNCGEEIGLGDDLSLKDREAARTPMQWRGDAPNAGFSTAPRDALRRPVIDDGPFAFRHVNVADQRDDPRSLLSFFRRALRAYKGSPALGRGTWGFPDSGDAGVLVHCADWPGSHAICIHNLTDQPKVAHVDLPDDARQTLHDGDDYEVLPKGRVALRPFGYRWFDSPGDDSPDGGG